MRFSVTHYRVIFLIVNILLGLGVPSFAAYRYFHTPIPSTAGEVVVADLKKFEPRDDGSLPPEQNSAGKVAIVATWVNPKPAALPPGPDTTPPTPGGTVPSVDTTSDGPELPPGKLGDDGWYYYSYILRQNPLKTFVMLRKKDLANPAIPAPGAAPGSVRTNPRVRPPPKPALRSSKMGRIAQQAGDHISFHVDEREYINEELGLDFMIHSADEKQFVYWLRESGPNKKFALKHQTESRYQENPYDGLKPRPKTPEEQAPEGAPEEKKKSFILHPKDFESSREGEYQDMLKGIGLEPVSTPSDGGLRTLKPATDGAQPTLPPPGANGAQPGKAPLSTANTAPRGPRPPTAAESKQLKDAIRAIPPDAQKELLQGLNKAGMNAPK